ncbi:MAG: hypothetical protein RI911_43 [Candidatus Parcubacteria bacterium]|jgi:peptide methionine sulfoxide reductase msrA/msrB
MDTIVHLLKTQWLLIILLALLSMIAWRVLPLLTEKSTVRPPQKGYESNSATAYVAGGCFWCTESDFEKLPGVIDVVSGYANGTTLSPNYETYHDGDHIEAVMITYDTRYLSYEDIVRHLFDHIDFLDAEGQFVDRGYGYQSALLYRGDDERIVAEKVRDEFNMSGAFASEVKTLLAPFTYFYPAEEYHQNYHTKNHLKYSYYRGNSGRDGRVETLCALREGTSLMSCGSTLRDAEKRFMNSNNKDTTMQPWKSFQKPTDEVLKEQLSEMSYYVTQHDGTERPFENEYDKNNEAGIYVDVLSGEPLFSSDAKFDSGTGWPSFYEPIQKDAVAVKTDWKLLYPRSEVRSTIADSHLGHVFDDGPEPTGKRYCMNSAALRFIPRAEMEAAGYGEYLGAVQEK